MPRKTAKADVIPVRQQNQYNCMTTSLAMALRALGVPEDECSPQQVNKVVGAMPLRGAAWEPLLAAANHYGMRATLTLPSTVRQLKEWTDAGIPVVIAWNPENREWSHASLVFDVDDDLNVYVADPNIPDPDETVRFIAAQMLGTHRAHESRLALSSALTDTSVFVRVEAARALGQLGDTAAVKSLVKLLKRGDGPDSEAARRALLVLTDLDYVVLD